MTTLVVCLDRTDDVGRRTGLESPIVGWEAVRALVTDVGLADPEDSGVNSLLETLRVAQELRDENESVVVAVVSGDHESMVSADRAVATQVDELVAEHDPDSAVVIIDSAEDERLVPIVESRVQVDSVDRVVVRQARDIESTYYLLKQFLADEKLRQTVLVPIGLTLLAFPILATAIGPAAGAAAITTVIGMFLLYEGFNVSELLTRATHQVRESLYSGQVSVVTYVVAAGLTLVGLFAGMLGVSNLGETAGVLTPVMQFTFDSIPWLATAALTASAGRLLDEAISDEPIRTSFLNLPFVVVSVAFVIRGFSAYFLEQQAVIDPAVVPAYELGVVSNESFAVTAGERLAVFVILAIIVSLAGAKTASSISSEDREGGVDADDSTATDSSAPPEPTAEVTDGGSGTNEDPTETPHGPETAPTLHESEPHPDDSGDSDSDSSE